MGEIRIDLTNVVTISLIGFLGVWAINRALNKFNLGQWSA